MQQARRAILFPIEAQAPVIRCARIWRCVRCVAPRPPNAAIVTGLLQNLMHFLSCPGDSAAPPAADMQNFPCHSACAPGRNATGTSEAAVVCTIYVRLISGSDAGRCGMSQQLSRPSSALKNALMRYSLDRSIKSDQTLASLYLPPRPYFRDV
jgi:hypothetical protein